MKRSMKRLMITVLTLVLLVTSLGGTFPAYAADDAVSVPVSSNNIGMNNYTNSLRWARTVDSYLVDNGNGTVTRVESVGSKVVVETYDSGMNMIDGFAIDKELPLFGGFYYGSDRNYLVFGQSNLTEDDAVEVVRVVAYTRDWERIDAASLYGANTYVPFDAGSLRFAEYGGYLYIRTSHTMYTYSDGLNHQSNMTINVRISDMTVTDSFTKIMNNNYGYVSHSFDQYIGVDGTTLVAADLGDAGPRAVVLMRYFTPAGQDSFMSNPKKVPAGNGYYYYAYVESLNVLPISGDHGDNDTGVSMGAFRITDTHYLVAGTTVEQGEQYNAYGQRNIFVTATDKNNFTTEGTSIRYFTGYGADAAVKVNNPYLVPLEDGNYFLIWSETVSGSQTLKYCLIDSAGEPVDDRVYTAQGVLSGCEPIVFEGKLLWYATSNTAPAFFTIDLENPEQASHSHIYTYSVSTYPSDRSPGALSSTCSICGEAGEDVVMPPILGSDEYTLSNVFSEPTCTKNGRGMYCWNKMSNYTSRQYNFSGTIPAKGHEQPVYTDAGDTHSVDYPCCDAQDASAVAHCYDENTHLCVCGKEDPDYKSVVIPEVMIKSASLSFEDEILVNLYYDVSDMTSVTEQGVLVFYADPGGADIAKADLIYAGSTFAEGYGLYMNTTDGIAAKDMGDDRYYCAYTKLSNGQYVYSDPIQYSPKQYAISRLEKSTDPRTKALCVAMLNYGTAAQQYFGYRTDDLMNAGLTAQQQALVTAYDASFFKGAEAVDANKIGAFAATDGFSARSASVSFEGAFAINYYFAPSAAVEGDLQLYIWNPETYAGASQLTAENASDVISMTAQEGGAYWGQVKGIAAKALDDTYYVAGVYTDAEGNTHCTGVIAYSLSKYCMNNAKPGKDMQALAAATAMYGYYAGEYFAA